MCQTLKAQAMHIRRKPGFLWKHNFAHLQFCTLTVRRRGLPGKFSWPRFVSGNHWQNLIKLAESTAFQS